MTTKMSEIMIPVLWFVEILWFVVIVLILVMSIRAKQAQTYLPADKPVERIAESIRSTDICELNAVVCDYEITTITRTVTAYTASADETDNEPCIAARNYNLCEDKTIKVVATNEYPIGTQLMIDNVPYTVLDRMNKRYPNRYDILVETKAEAMAYGVQTKEIKVIK